MRDQNGDIAEGIGCFMICVGIAVIIIAILVAHRWW